MRQALSALHLITCVIFTATLWDRYDFSHFVAEENFSQDLNAGSVAHVCALNPMDSREKKQFDRVVKNVRWKFRSSWAQVLVQKPESRGLGEMGLEEGVERSGLEKCFWGGIHRTWGLNVGLEELGKSVFSWLYCIYDLSLRQVIWNKCLRSAYILELALNFIRKS